MVRNLPESFVYRRLPEAIITADERGLVAAIVGGFQDRLEDVRSYSRKIQFFLDPSKLPEGSNNVVLVDLITDQGVAFTRSLDIDDSTPTTEGTQLTTWAAGQLDLPVESLSNVRFGNDPLRQIDTNTLGYLAETIGAVIYESKATSQEDKRQIVQTYFPRLRIKGTAKSFEVLGKVLGFADTAFVPLWSRLSARRPDDPGNADNNPDFSPQPEFWPAKTVGPLYDPNAQRDGAFFTWTTAVNQGTAATDFYTQSVNGRNPFVSVTVLGVTSGTVTHPVNGTYALANGGPHSKAYIDASTDVRFTALAEGESWNGLGISVSGSGTSRTLAITDQLSSVKYRSSYFDLIVVADSDSADATFGQRSVRPSPDLASNPTLTSDGTAVTPYRPWSAGSIASGSVVTDWLVRVQDTPQTTVTARVQASGTNDELVFGELTAAATQVTVAVEEVRPATRFLRRTGAGLLVDEQWPYARYTSQGLLGVTAVGTVAFSGSHPSTPLAPYYAQILLVPDSGSPVYAQGELSPSDANLASYRYESSHIGLAGTYSFSSGSYAITVVSDASGTGSVYAVWTPTSTEVIRTEPSAAVKNAGESGYQQRPEDEEDETLDEVGDEYPWTRAVVGGGELVAAANYIPDEGDAVEVDSVAAVSALLDQNGVAYDAHVRVSATGHHRLILPVRPTDASYTPPSEAIGYSGTFIDLSAYTDYDIVNASTDFDQQFEPGYGIYHVGLVRGVAVADPVAFNAPAIREGWTAWFPLNEHAEDALGLHEADGADAVVSGMFPEDRVWTDERGWVLRPTGSLVAEASISDVPGELTVGFWIKGEGDGSVGGSSTILEFGPISFDFNHGSNAVTGYARQTAGSRIAIGTVVANAWTYVALVVTETSARFVYGQTTLAEFTVMDSFQVGAETLTLVGALSPFLWHDLRVWSQAKALADLQAAAVHVPTKTIVNYPLSQIPSVDKSAAFGLVMLPNGWITPGALPPWIRRDARLAVRRYISDGSYVGRSAYKEVGLGGGVALFQNYGLTTYPLGYAFPYDSAGTMVVAGTTGQLPGNNKLWFDTSGAASTQVSTNPARDAVWIKGQDNYVYEVTLTGNPTSTGFLARKIERFRTQEEITVNPIYQALLTTGTYASASVNGTQPLVGGVPVGPATINTVQVYLGSLAVAEQITGAEVRLEGSNYRMTVLATGSAAGIVSQGTMPGAATTPPLWMYLPARIIEEQTDAWQTWTNRDDTSQFGNTFSPPLAALDANGILDFESATQLTAGLYRLYLDTGNLGLTDPDFDGFRVEVSVNNTLVEARLLRGQSGQNIRGWDVLEFNVPVATTGTWLLSIEWLNAYTDQTRGYTRQLVVYGYKLERVAQELWRVTINPSGGQPTLENYTVQSGTYAYPVAGGWLLSLSSSGALQANAHESNVLVRDTGTLPLADILTGSTNERRQDIIIHSASGDLIEPDEAVPVFPSFGSVIASSGSFAPLWAWASAVNTNPGFTVSAKMPADCTVRLVVSTGTDFADPVYSPYAYAYTDNNRVAKMTVSGLESWTNYYYALEVNGQLVTPYAGQARTFGTDARSFKFAIGSCSNNVRGTAVNTAIWDSIVAKSPDFFFVTGDWHYNNIAINNPNYFRDAIDAIFLSNSEYTFLTAPAANTGSTKQRSLWARMPVVWIWDDHDYGPNDSDATSPSRTASRAVYREYCPHYPLQAGGPDAPIYFTFRVGRCVFVVTDNRSERSPKGNTDNASKIVWSAEQKAWFQAQVLAASNDPDVQVIFWVNTFPWIGAASAGADYWAGYTTARQEIVDWLDDNAITKVFILSGDMHASAIDDGRNSPGGMPVFHAAPLYQTSSNKGGPYFIGPTPGSGIANTSQFGMVEVSDYGTATYVSFTGYDSAGTMLTVYGTNVTLTLQNIDSPYA